MSSEYLCNPLYYVEAMRHKHPQLLNEWCRTELSNVLDFSGTAGLGQVLAGVIDMRQGKTVVKKFSKSKQRANSQTGVFGAHLTEEGYCQARQLIDFLKDYITKEGIFRIPGNSERQRRLKDKICSGLLVDLDNDVFTPHDVACVLKTYLGDLPEPLLTDKHYPAHVQAAGLTYQIDQVPSLSEDLGRQYRAQKTHEHVTALRYLFLMLPPLNFKMLQEILELLYSVAEKEEQNKMSAFNLAVMFAPHILWPRYLTADDLRDQVLINKLNCGAEFMITHFHKIFKVPAKMLKRCEQYIKHGRLLDEEDKKPSKVKSQDDCDGKSGVGPVIGNPQTPTVSVKKEQNQTEAALARLYASVQDMPSSSKKRRLMKQFAKNSNMPGTPTRVKEDLLLQSRRQHKHTRSKSVGDAVLRHVSTPGHTKKRRAAPNPPEEHEKTVQQRLHMRDMRCELRDQLQRGDTRASPGTRSSMRAIATSRMECAGSPSPRGPRPAASSPRGPRPAASSPTVRTRQKRPAPLTPKQLADRMAGAAIAASSSSGVVKPVPLARSSVRMRKRRSDGQPAETPEGDRPAGVRPVPKPRNLKENRQEPATHQPRQYRQKPKHELNSLV